jgi:hypothetical protein
MPNSWEWYQQQDGGTLPIFQIAGLCNDAPFGGFNTLSLLPNCLYVVPFDEMRAVILSSLMVNLVSQDSNPGAQVRLGIYQNNSTVDNFPNTLILDAGTLTIDDTASTGILSIGSLTQALTADVRYWLALFTSANVSDAQIGGLPPGSAIPFGVFRNPSAGSGYGFAVARQVVLPYQTYGPLPSPYPLSELTIDNIAINDPVPAIGMTFSKVT